MFGLVEDGLTCNVRPRLGLHSLVHHVALCYFFFRLTWASTIRETRKNYQENIWNRLRAHHLGLNLIGTLGTGKAVTQHTEWGEGTGDTLKHTIFIYILIQLIILLFLSQRFPPQNYLLLLKISTVFLIYQHQVEKVTYRKAIVDRRVRRCQIGRDSTHW